MTEQATQTTSPGSAAPDAANPANASAPQTSAAAASQSTHTTQPARPDWLAESYWDGEKNEIKGADLAAALKERDDLKAATEAAKAAIPESADKYALDLPADFKLPDGFEVNKDDQRIAGLREAALEAGLDQAKFTALFGKLAQADALAQKAQADLVQQGIKARDAALGPQAAQRIDALHSWFDGAFDAETAKSLKDTLILPKQIEAMEKVALALKNGGVAGFNGKGRDGGRTDGKPENWESMSALDRRTWQLQTQR